MRRRQLRRNGTPIEEAPLWVLAIFAALLWLVTFPALTGLLAVAVLVVAGLASRRPWQRPRPTDLHDPRPLFVRFSSWLIAALLVPNVLFGVLVLTHEGPPLTYEAALLLGALVSAIHGVVALAERFRAWLRRRRGAAG